MTQLIDPADVRDAALLIASQANGIFLPREHALASLTEHYLVAPSLEVATKALSVLSSQGVAVAVTIEFYLIRIWCKPRDRLRVAQMLEKYQ